MPTCRLLMFSQQVCSVYEKLPADGCAPIGWDAAGPGVYWRCRSQGKVAARVRGYEMLKWVRRTLEPKYDAFISYSHARDREIAKALQSQMQRYARPWYRVRAVKVFRDETDLGASPGLWPDIERALSRARWLLVMASPESAQSVWVRKEIAWWLAHRSSEHILLAWTGGTLGWDSDAGAFDWHQGCSALPQQELAGIFAHQPRWVDLRDVHRGPESADWDKVDLAEYVLDFAAPIRGKSKAELHHEHVRLRNQIIRMAASVITALLLLLTASVVTGNIAVGKWRESTGQALAANSQRLAAQATEIQDTAPGLARQLLAEAYRQAPTGQAVGALLQSASIPQVIRTTGYSRGVAMGKRRDVLATASDEGVVLYDSTTATRLATIPAQGGYTGAVAFSPDERILAAAGADGIVRLYDIASARNPVPLGSVQTLNGIVLGLVFSPSAPLFLAEADNGAVVSVRVTNPHDPVVADTAPGFPTAVIDAGSPGAVDPTGRLAAAPGLNGTTRILQIASNGILTQISSFADHSSVVAFSPSGHLLALAGNDSLTRLWDIADPRHPIARPVLDGQTLGIDSLAFSSTGSTLATGAGDGSIQLWDLADPLNPVAGARLTGHSFEVANLAFDRTDHILASVGSDGPPLAKDGSYELNGTVRLWPVVGAQRSAVLARIPAIATGSLAFSSASSLLAVGSPAGLWQVSDPEHPQLAASLPTFNVGGTQTAFSPDGGILATGNPLKLWDLSDPSHPRDLSPATPVSANAVVAFGSTRQLVALVGADSTVQLWNVTDRQHPVLVGSMPTTTGVRELAFQPNGQILTVLDSRGAVELWNITDQHRPIRQGTISISGDPLTALAFGQDADTLLTGSTRGMLSAWNVHVPSHPRPVGNPQQQVHGITGLAYDPEQSLAATGSQGGAVQIWSLDSTATPVSVATLAVPGGSDVLSFSPDGKLLAADTSAGIQLWDVDVHELLNRVCAQSPQITRAQWAQYQPGKPYDPACQSPH
ncbi:MAG: hypothetical protein JWO67_59 [Streptosporangiaceae bacterium]|nr:hypothetical protein [Streptosporangiaceae bacterium]